MSPPPPTRQPYLISLQVFRGIAAMWVLLFHVGVVSWLRLGYPFMSDFILAGGHAVIFFFVLSGFVIMYVHRGHLGNPANVRPYLARRFSRIYPLVIVIVSIKLLYAAISGAYDIKELTPEIAIKSLLLAPAPYYVIDVLWTLVFEVVFYLLFAFAVAFGKRAAAAGAAVWILFVLGRQLAGCLLYHESMIQTIGHPFCLLFLMGVACATISMNSKWMARTGWLWIPGFALMAFCIWYLDSVADSLYVESGTHNFLSIILWGLASSLIILSAVSLEKRNKLRWPAWLVASGDASYSIYLLHTSLMVSMAMVLLRFHISPAASPVLILTAIGLISLAGSLIFWRWVERPLMAWWRRWILPVMSGGRKLQEVPAVRQNSN
jgi:exopolysaccharide production protein ExoZ